MHSLWQGALNFGLVNIPVKLYSATDEVGLDLDMLHKTDMSPIHYARICKKEEKEIPYDNIIRGFKVAKGKYVPLTPEDFANATVKKTKTIAVEQFVRTSEIDPIYMEKSYYLEPDKNAEVPYALLREALQKTKKVGVATFVLRHREMLAIVHPLHNTLVLTQLRFQKEIRPAAKLRIPGAAKRGRELSLAVKLIEDRTATFDAKKYKDTYIQSLRNVIKQKSQGKVFRMKETAHESPTTAHNLMIALKASLEKKPASARGSRK